MDQTNGIINTDQKQLNNKDLLLIQFNYVL